MDMVFPTGVLVALPPRPVPEAEFPLLPPSRLPTPRLDLHHVPVGCLLPPVVPEVAIVPQLQQYPPREIILNRPQSRTDDSYSRSRRRRPDIHSSDEEPPRRRRGLVRGRFADSDEAYDTSPRRRRSPRRHSPRPSHVRSDPMSSHPILGLPASVPYGTIDQSWDESDATWTPPAASPPAGATFVVYRRRRTMASSERVFTLVRIVDRALLDSIRTVCPTLDGLYTHDGMVALNLLYPHVDKLRCAPNAVGLSAFLEFIEDEFGPHQKRIAALSAEGQTRYEYLWAIYKPGTELAIRLDGNDDFIGAIVDSAEYLAVTPGPYFVIKYRTLEWTGEKMCWTLWATTVPPFEGYESIAAIGPRLVNDERRTRMTEIGRKFVQFTGNGGIHHVQLTGTIILNAGQEVSAIGMGIVDPVMFTKFFPARRAGLQILRQFEHTLEREDTLWLMPSTLECYSFAAHTWGMVRVANIQPLAHEGSERAWSRLIMDDDDKGAIRALVEGKPPAVIFLHGPSCTGKTFTVEALAAALRRPIYLLGGSEHGATSVSSSVDYTLEMAERWNAIMLLEDANDHCAGPDHQRAQFVDCLLRALHMRKISAPPLIMTSRRMHAFASTMLHRLTLAVAYTPPDYMQRLQLWEQYIDDILEDAPRDELLLLARSRDKPVMHSENLRELATKPFNALDIQGLVQSAHALAVSQQEPLSIHHFREFIHAKEKFLRDTGMIVTPDEAAEEDDDEDGSEATEADQ